MQEFLKYVSLHGKKIANKNLGQNFLTSKEIIDNIVLNAEINSDTSVIEIGCGLGSLTYAILEKTKKFVGIEKDPLLVDVLINQFLQAKFINADAMRFDFPPIVNSNTVIISNLPYNVGTKIVVKLGIEVLSQAKNMTVMLQKDVILKIISKYDSDSYHQMGVFFQSFCDITHICDVPSSVFSPAPNIISSVVKIVAQSHEINVAEYWSFIQKAFCFKRKKLSTIFTLVPQRYANKRPEDIKPREFLEIFINLKNTV
ncbi:MAG: 16S rRNA (adenine1518-N6/adenine1519-N6)-dimethyltransferase [Candidatus Deianiraeaceae bacterium]|jgi:16S rRNA (adenine1518-N6/adenine1519-N6)-dimethyltransferase